MQQHSTSTLTLYLKILKGNPRQILDSKLRKQKVVQPRNNMLSNLILFSVTHKTVNRTVATRLDKYTAIFPVSASKFDFLKYVWFRNYIIT